MAKGSDNRRKAARLMDQKVTRGSGGRTHQVAENGVPLLATQQGTPVVDDQNSLKIYLRESAVELFFWRREDRSGQSFREDENPPKPW
jgi:catalase